MGVFANIKFPEPVGDPPTESSITYTESSELLPVEKTLLEYVQTFANLVFDFDLDEVKAVKRTHTVYGHFTDFLTSGIESQPESPHHITFELKESQTCLCAIVRVNAGHPTNLEIFPSKDKFFPSDGLTQTAVEIHF